MGTYSLQQLFQITRKKFPSRFDNMKRDKIKLLRIREVKVYDNLDNITKPNMKYIVETKSNPNYGDYIKFDSKGKKKIRKTNTQRTWTHKYDVTLVFFKEMSMSSTDWRGSLGAMTKWRKAPQNKVKTIRRETLARWKKKFKDDKKKLNKRIANHRKKAPFLNDGDWNASFGRNGDFIFRDAFAFFYHDHLFGRNYFGNKPSKLNPKHIPFLPKHMIKVILELGARGWLKS